ncbi:FkbM family methyltransferase [Algoriphagus yeomjeoni]|uniref:FkbM family methyltransferase n=1 Tax=Algoriphagus yeomjeoni TaxID=291403 RepID=UPI003CE4910C
MRQKLLKIFRSKVLQPLWIKLHHISLIGMNYFGGASLNHSGEIWALNYMKEKLKGKDKILIFDVGANSGEYSLLANELFENKSTIHAFEPSSFTFKILEEKTENYSQIKPHKLGIGSENTLLKLYSSGNGRTTASVYNLAYSLNYFNEEFTESIEVTSVDFFCRENDIEVIDILKIDIEGHELAAIKGAKNMIESNSLNFIQFEFGKCDIDSKVFFRDFYELLSPGFKLFRIVSDGLYEIEYYDSSLEVFHTANYLAERR